MILGLLITHKLGGPRLWAAPGRHPGLWAAPGTRVVSGLFTPSFRKQDSPRDKPYLGCRGELSGCVWGLSPGCQPLTCSDVSGFII